MASEKPAIQEMFHTIARLSAEADWTEEELKEAIRAEGGDPDLFAHTMLPKIKDLLEKRRSSKHGH